MDVRPFTPLWQRRFSWATAGWLLVAGLLVGYLAWQQASGYERERTTALFTRQLADRAVVLDRALHDITSELTRAARLLGMNPSMGRDAFRLIVSEALAKHGLIHAFEWAPLLTDDARSAHEQGVRGDGFARYALFERHSDRRPVSRARHPRYAPVLYIEPLQPNRQALGFDLLSEPYRRAALTAAAARLSMVLTGSIDFVQGGTGVLAVMPVLRAAPVEGADAPLAGFVVVVLRGEDLLRHMSFRQADPASSRVRFALVDETHSPHTIARSTGWESRSGAPQEWSHRFEVGTRRWHLSGQPTPVFYAEHSTRQPLMTGLAAFALWGSLALTVLALTSGAHREARREQDEIVRAALNSASDGVVVADMAGRCLLMNDAAARVLGRHDVGDVLHMSSGYVSADGLTPIALDQLPLALVLRGESATEIEALVRRSHSETGTWLSIHAAPIRNGGDHLLGGVLTFRDITARRDAEAAVRLSNSHLQEFRNALDEAMMVTITDRDDRILYVNHLFCQISGFSREELVGTHHPLCDSEYHPPEFTRDLLNTIHDGRTWRGTICGRGKNGATFWTDTTIAPLTEHAGDANRYLAVHTDVSDRVRHEASLRRLSHAIEQTADSIFITDSEGVIDYVNSGFETTTGYSREEAIGRTPSLLKSGRQDAAYYERLWAAIKGGDVFRSKPINRRKNGQEYHAEQTITPIRDGAGRITHFVSVVKDVSERIRQEERDIEMAYAARVQQQLYPREAPVMQGFDLGGAVLPAAGTAGDYFDFLPMPDGTLAVAVADVCGHGLASALIMAQTRAYLRPLTAAQTNPAAIFEQINRWLHEDLSTGRQYVTMVLLCLDRAADRLVYASAGHVPGCVIDRAGAMRTVLDSTGVPLGMFAESAYGAPTGVALQPGDIIVLLTDGVTEAEGADGRLFGVEGAIRTVREHRDEPARDIAQHVLDAARAFADGSPISDDITIVICKVVPQN
jgi:PAS domain S-box-containing protein